MRIDTPGGNWVELRSAEDLTGADDDAWHAIFYQVRLEADEEAASEGDDGMEVSADGVTMVPKKRHIKVPPDFAYRQRDTLLASLITDWSYKDAPFSLPLPYSAESRKTTESHKGLPLAACKALDEAIKPHKAALNGSGPKETTGPGSENGSAAGSTAPLTDLTPAQPVTA
jgi:hypothetical protein